MRFAIGILVALAIGWFLVRLRESLDNLPTYNPHDRGHDEHDPKA
jgi:hypothetical protein